jgi:hypothetical protein
MSSIISNNFLFLVWKLSNSSSLIKSYIISKISEL